MLADCGGSREMVPGALVCGFPGAPEPRGVELDHHGIAFFVEAKLHPVRMRKS